jgi:hypothetical protein
MYCEMPLEGHPEMTRFPRPAKQHPSTGHGARQTFVVVVAIAAVLGLGAFATDQFIGTAKRQAGGTYQAAKGDDIYTGSILYMPDTSNVCHQWLFDNQTGQFTDKGSVDCQEAADQSLDGPKNWSTARIRVISTGFRDH